jgi:hypothetical protein
VPNCQGVDVKNRRTLSNVPNRQIT